MTIYVAARFTEKVRARVARATLMNAGYQVTSRWLYQDTSARQNLDDVHRSDVLVLLESEIGCGRYIEMGYATALGRPIVVIGMSDPFSFWCSLPQVTTWSSLTEAMPALAALAVRIADGPATDVA